MTITGYPLSPLGGYISGTDINLGVPAVGPHTYTLTRVADACGNFINPNIAYTINIYANPVLSSPTPALQTICNNASASIILNSTVNNTIFDYTVASVPAAGYSWTAGKDPVNGSITDADGNGTETLSRQLQHNSNAAVVVTYTITPTGPGATACVGTPITRTVTVNPVAAITNMAAMVCSATGFTVSPVDVTNGIVPAGTTYSWSAPAGAGFTGGAASVGTPTSITGTLTNTTSAAVTATYTVTPTSSVALGSCAGATFTVIVTVNPRPAVTDMTATTCSATGFTVTPVDVTNGKVPAGTTYSWSAPTGAGFTGEAASVGTPTSITGTLTNTTSAAVTATYTVTPKSSVALGSCAGATFTVIVTVNPRPAVTDMTATTCSATGFTVTPVDVTNGKVPAGTTFSWSAPTGAGFTGGAASVGTPTSITGTLTNTTSAAVTATYTVTPTSSVALGSCAGATFTVIVTVNPRPAVTDMTATTCSATGFTVTPVDVTNGKVPAGTTYSWSAPAGAGFTGGAANVGTPTSITGTLTNTTSAAVTATYTVTPTSSAALGSCAGATFTVIVTVNPRPAVTDMTATTCSATGFTVTPVDVTNGKVPAGTTYSWGAPTVTGGITGGAANVGTPTSITGTLTNPTTTVQTATYTVTPKSSAALGSCAGATFTIIVTVNPKPAVTDMTATTCSATGFTVTPVDVTNGKVPAGTTYSWSAPAGAGFTGGAANVGTPTSITGTLTNTTSAAVTATYTVTPTSSVALGSCAGATFTVIVTVNPRPAVTDMTATTCSATGFTVTPVDVTNGKVPAGTTYSWSAPTGAGFTGGAASVGTPTSITGTLTNTTSAAVTATYTVTPTSSVALGSCAGATFTVIVTVNPRPAVTDMTATTCSATGFTVTPVDVTNGKVPAGTTYSWSAPAGAGFTGEAASVGTPTSITGTLTNTTSAAVTATYTVTPKSSVALGSCAGATFTVIVTVNPRPAVTDMTATTCSATGFTVTPVDVTNGKVPAGTTFSWSAPTGAGFTGGAASVGTPTSITGTLTNTTSAAVTATYTVTPTSSVALGSCAGATFTVIVTVNPRPAVTDMTATTCSATGFTVTPVDVTNGKVPAGTTYSWSAPAGAGFTGGAANVGTPTSITGTLTNTTSAAVTATYTVTPTSSVALGSCAGATFTVIVTVNPKPAVTNMTATTCSATGFTVTPVDVTNGKVPAGTTYSWSAPTGAGFTGGAASVGTPTSITGTLTNTTSAAVTATYTVTPTSSVALGSCAGATFTVIVTVNPRPAVTDMTATTCSATGFTVTPADVTNGKVPAGTTYSWSAPTGAGFTGGAASVGTPTSITGTLTNTTSAAVTATYTVTPTSSVALGSCAGATFTVIVTVNPKPAVTDMAYTTCSAVPFSVTPVDVTNGIVPAGTTYSWGLPVVTGGMTGGATGSGVASLTGTLTNPTTTAQTATYTVTPLSGTCTGASFTVTVTIDTKPSVTAMASPVCSGAGFTVTPVNGTDGIIPPGTTYSWGLPVVTGGITGEATGIGAASITGTLTNPTNTQQTATYTVTPSIGSCDGADFTVTITVNPTPGVTDMTSVICSEGTFTSTPSNGANGIVPAGTDYSWGIPVLSGGITGEAAGSGLSITGTLTNTTNTAQTATYTVTPTSSVVLGSCVGSDFTVTVTVDPKPAITPITSTVCSDAGFTITPVEGTDGIVPAGTTYSWAVPSVTGSMTGGAPGIGAANISGNLTNPTNIPQTAIYTVTPLSGACTGITFTVTVTVNPKPSIALITYAACSGSAFTVTPANGTDGIVPAGTTYSWAAPSVTGSMTGGAAGSGEVNIFGTLINTSGVPQTATYRVTPLSGSCTGADFFVMVTVNPLPAISAITGSALLCSDATNKVYQVANHGVTSSYTWTVPGAILTKTFDANLYFILVDAAGTGSGNIQVTETIIATGCSAAATPFNVTVSPVIPGVVVAGPITICEGDAGVAYSVPDNPGSTYSWIVTGASITSADPTLHTIDVSFPTSGSVNISVSEIGAGGCLTVHTPIVVTVNHTPAITNMNSTICSGGTFTATPANGTNGTVPVGTTYTWAAPSVTGGITGGAAGTAAANISGTLVNPTSTFQSATYTVTPVTGTCTGAAFYGYCFSESQTVC